MWENDGQTQFVSGSSGEVSSLLLSDQFRLSVDLCSLSVHSEDVTERTQGPELKTELHTESNAGRNDDTPTVSHDARGDWMDEESDLQLLSGVEWCVCVCGGGFIGVFLS